jgi:hypothetical protein
MSDRYATADDGAQVQVRWYTKGRRTWPRLAGLGHATQPVDRSTPMWSA